MKTDSLFRTLLVTAAIAAVLVLYIFGRTTPKQEKTSAQLATEQQVAQTNLNLDQLVSQAQAELNDQEKKEWQSISQSEDLDQSRAFWFAQDRYDLAALYAAKQAEQNPSAEQWNLSGDLAVRAYREAQDSIHSSYFVNQAISSYEDALELDADNETKLKLALLHTSVTGQIMKGVALLQDIVANEPNHIQANYELALLSIQSGQDDKAINRLNTIIAAKPDFIEAYIYKAQLALKNENKELALQTIDAAMANSTDENGTKVLNDLRNKIVNQ